MLFVRPFAEAAAELSLMAGAIIAQVLASTCAMMQP